MANAAIDQNGRWTLTALSSANDGTIVDVWADPITHRLLVDSAAGSGTVTLVSVVSANGFAGTVANATTTPAITLSTTITGVLKGNGTAISAATANTDYQSPITLTTTGTSGAATFNGTTLNIPNYTTSGGTPGGSNTQIQYNNSGAFGGVSGATTNGTAITFAASALLISGSSSGTVTLNAPATGGGTLTLPQGTDTVIGRASTDTLTNKTYDTAGTGNSFLINGLAATANTGTGSVVRATSPTLVTPILGTPTSGTLTNCTGLPVAGGGTGAASFTAYSVVCAGTTSTGAFQNVSGVGTSGQVLTSNGAGALPTWQAAASGTSIPQMFYYFGANSGGSTTSMGTLNQYTDTTNGLAYVMDLGGGNMSYCNPSVGNYQNRAYTTDWASATAVNASITLGSFLYVLFRNGTTAYQLWRYTANNLAGGATQVTFSGKSLAYNNTNQIMFTDGTSLFFNFQTGNSANDYIVSKFSISGTTATFVSDITCGAAANVMNRILKIDGSTNLWGFSTSDFKVRKYNSSGTLQSTSGSMGGHYRNQSYLTLGTYPFTEDNTTNSDTSSVYFMAQLNISS